MQSLRQVPDSRGHMPGCSQFGGQPTASEDSGYADLFCECHKWEEPRILPGGTNVAWPLGWTQQMASEWRERNKLVPPSEPESGL